MKKRDLRSMANQTAKAAGTPPENMEGETRRLEDMAAQFSGKSQQELMSELMRRSAQKKADGSLSSESLENFFKSAAPMLTPEQRRNMRKLIDQIK